ncbi:hypothetical protein ABS71_14160 [bacterium SCN 62-11]|nr:hypothetical protein [Candidatus Eremiobacteraeota bacterium]ODT63585.1 MAG: hypothetical protein ABS71_14160 [bacterium SCN 62-11]
MLKPAVLVSLLTVTVAAKPVTYRDGSCQVNFPGAFRNGQQAVSYVRPDLQLYMLSWPTSPGQATAFLANLQEQSRSRGSATSYVTQSHRNGLQIFESLSPSDRTISQFYVLYGRCYEFRACVHDDKKHPEVDQFFSSIRFRARTVNLRVAIQNYGVPSRPRPAAAPAGRGNPYSF